MGGPLYGQGAGIAAQNGPGSYSAADDVIRAVDALNRALGSARSTGWTVEVGLKERAPNGLAEALNALNNPEEPRGRTAVVTAHISRKV